MLEYVYSHISISVLFNFLRVTVRFYILLRQYKDKQGVIVILIGCIAFR